MAEIIDGDDAQEIWKLNVVFDRLDNVESDCKLKAARSLDAWDSKTDNECI